MTAPAAPRPWSQAPDRWKEVKHTMALFEVEELEQLVAPGVGAFVAGVGVGIVFGIGVVLLT